MELTNMSSPPPLPTLLLATKSAFAIGKDQRDVRVRQPVNRRLHSHL